MTRFDAVALILRLSIGLTIVAHGYNHIFGPGGIQGTARWFASMGLRPGIVHAWTSGLLEIGAGVALAAGFLTPLCAAAIVGIMVTAFAVAHRKNGFFIFREGWEYVFVIAAVCVCIGALGPGEASIDHLLDIDDDLGGWTGALIALAGVVGSAAMLAAAYRPGAVQPAAVTTEDA